MEKKDSDNMHCWNYNSYANKWVNNLVDVVNKAERQNVYTNPYDVMERIIQLGMESLMSEIEQSAEISDIEVSEIEN